MKLINLQLTNFRNISKLKINIEKNINIIFGGNAQGKTSILEAIYLLGITKSFRVNDDRAIVNREQDFYEVVGTFQKNSKTEIHIRLFFSIKEGKHIFLEGERVKTFSTFIGRVPVILLSLEDLELTYGAPAFRRKFMDILISQIDPLYLQSLKQQVKILKQRNKVLTLIREGEQQQNALIPWDLQLAEHGSYICLKRGQILNQISPIVSEYYQKIAGGNETIEIKYQTFLEQALLQKKDEIKQKYLSKLSENKERDIAYGSTTIGPHRDDLIFQKNGVPIKVFGSQGENKTFLISLKFAEAKLIEKNINEQPILLLDDIFSELDMRRIQMVVENIQNMQYQTFITTTDVKKFDSRLGDVALWNIRDGQVYEAA